MGKSLTIDFIRNFIEIESKSGCKLLSDNYLGYDIALELLDKYGHRYKASFHSFKNQEIYLCSSCSRENAVKSRRTDIESIRNEIEKRDCTLLSDSYKNAKLPLKIKFSCGHIGERSIADFRMSRPFCKNCNPSCQLTFEYVKITC